MSKRWNGSLNGEGKKSFILVLVSLGVGALIAGVLGNANTRDKLVDVGKRFLEQ